jgi:hypothetical protein
LCNSAQHLPGCTIWANIFYKGSTAGATEFDLPDTGGKTATILVGGSNLTVSPTQFATVPGTNYSSNALIFQNSWYDGRLVFIQYNSGAGSVTGGTGDTCTLTSFNGGSTATATVALSAPNTLNPATIAIITSAGTGASSASPPTTATLGNGTATCTPGTVNVATVVGNGMGQFFFANAPGTGPNPIQHLILHANGTTGNSDVFLDDIVSLNLFNTNTATSGANFAAPFISLFASSWNGSVAGGTNWTITPSVAAGPNPLNTLTIAFGGIGSGLLALPANTTIGGNSVPAISGTPTATHIATWLNATTLQDGGVAPASMPVFNTGGTAITAPHMIYATGALAGGTLAVTLSGSAIYTSSSSYICQPQDTTTPANAVTVAYTSGTAFTLTGTGTDAIRYQCVGN